MGLKALYGAELRPWWSLLSFSFLRRAVPRRLPAKRTRLLPRNYSPADLLLSPSPFRTRTSSRVPRRISLAFPTCLRKGFRLFLPVIFEAMMYYTTWKKFSPETKPPQINANLKLNLIVKNLIWNFLFEQRGKQNSKSEISSCKMHFSISVFCPCFYGESHLEQ